MANVKILFLVSVLVASLSSAFCKKCRYRKYSPNHTACKRLNKSCPIVERGIPQSGQDEIIRLHNEYRQKIANGKEDRAGGMPQAANMEEMVWDKELAYVAQHQTDQCEFKHDCNDCRKVGRFAVGQNLYYGYNPHDYKGMMDLFYNEVKDYHKDFMKPFQAGPSGHFTQVVWATSHRVGCGRTVFKDGDWNKELISCNYGPAGNWMNDELYKVGSPCSSCPSGTSCSSTYPGLCNRIQKVGPWNVKVTIDKYE